MMIATLLSTLFTLPLAVNMVADNSKLVAVQVDSKTNGLSDCYHAAFIERERKVFAKCNQFRGIVHSPEKGREFSFGFPKGNITFYTNFKSPPGRFQDGIVHDGKTTRSYYINRIRVNNREFKPQNTSQSSNSRIRCYVIDDYTEVSCSLPDKSYIQYVK